MSGERSRRGIGPVTFVALVFVGQILMAVLVRPAGFSDTAPPAPALPAAASDTGAVTAGLRPGPATVSTGVVVPARSAEITPLEVDASNTIGGRANLIGPEGEEAEARAARGEDLRRAGKEFAVQPDHGNFHRPDAAALLPEPQPDEVLELVIATVDLPIRVFPVVGGGSFSASFGAPRPDDRTHNGIDIFAPKTTPVAAVASGTVVGVPDGPGDGCCFVRLEHDDGSATLYLHLNNDTPGSDDGLGWGVADGMVQGAQVQAGTVIGYVGDSGNAEETKSHLHFEYHAPGSGAVDPYEMLRASPVLPVAGAPLPEVTFSTSDPTELPFTGSSLGWLGSLGILCIAMGITAVRRSSSTPECP